MGHGASKKERNARVQEENDSADEIVYDIPPEPAKTRQLSHVAGPPVVHNYRETPPNVPDNSDLPDSHLNSAPPKDSSSSEGPPHASIIPRAPEIASPQKYAFNKEKFRMANRDPIREHGAPAETETVNMANTRLNESDEDFMAEILKETDFLALDRSHGII